MLATLLNTDGDPVFDPVDDPFFDPVDDPVDDPFFDPVDDPVAGPVDDPVDDPVAGPVFDPVGVVGPKTFPPVFGTVEAPV